MDTNSLRSGRLTLKTATQVLRPPCERAGGRPGLLSQAQEAQRALAPVTTLSDSRKKGGNLAQGQEPQKRAELGGVVLSPQASLSPGTGVPRGPLPCGVGPQPALGLIFANAL